jgi:hypothetical protein
MSEFLALFLLYGRLDAALDRLLDKATSTPVFALRRGISRLGCLLHIDIIYLFIQELDY